MHPALKQTESRKIIFTAYSKRNFHLRFLISKFALEQGCIPINPFLNFDYYLADLVDRDLIRLANNNLIQTAEELWVFGVISDGVLAEIQQANNRNQPIKYFGLMNDKDIYPSALEELEVEPGVTKTDI